MRGLSSRNSIIALVMFATGAQVARNMVVLHGLGVHITVLDAVALLIAAAAIGLLPVGPTLGAATSVLILGANGIAVVAAAGALLTATGAVGALAFAAWAAFACGAGRLPRRPGRRGLRPVLGPTACDPRADPRRPAALAELRGERPRWPPGRVRPRRRVAPLVPATRPGSGAAPGTSVSPFQRRMSMPRW